MNTLAILMNIKLPWTKLYYSDFLNGCRGLTHQQRGLYFTLFCLAGIENGRGLPNNFDELCHSVNIYDKNPEVVEQLKADLTLILNKKFVLVENRYHNQRQLDDFNSEIQTIINKSNAGKISVNNKRLTKAKQKLNTVSESESISIFNDIIWPNLKFKKGSKVVALNSYLKKAFDIDEKTLINKYNELCSNTAEFKFIPHFSTWLNQERWEEEIVVKEEKDEFSIQPKDSYRKYVIFVKKGIRSTAISDDMVKKMRKEGLITEEEFKAW